MSEEQTRHLLIVTTSYPHENTGKAAAGSFVEDLAAELARHIEVIVIAPSRERRVTRNGRLSVHYFKVPRLPLSLLDPGSPGDWWPIAETIRSGRKAVRHIVSRRRVDHIFALWALPSGYWAKALSSEDRVPYSIWALGSDIWSLGRLPLVKNLLKNVLKGGEHCFADGHRLAEDVKAISGRNCDFLPSSRRLERSRHRELAGKPPYKIAFLGRWHPNKGVDILLDALRMLEDKDWERIEEVRIFGGGPLEKEIYEGVSRLQGEDRQISVGGYLDKAEAADLLGWADYLTIPSRIESIPVIFSDAMQAGCIVITTPTGDLPRLMARYRVGTLSARIEPASYCQSLKEALNHSPAAYAEGLAEASDRFDISRTADEILKVLFSGR